MSDRMLTLIRPEDQAMTVSAEDCTLAELRCDDGRLTWYQDGIVHTVSGFDKPAEPLLGIDKPIPGPYQVLKTEDTYYLIFEDNVPDEENNQTDMELFAYVYDGEAWGDAVPLTSLGQTVLDFAGFVDQGTLQLAVTAAQITPEDGEFTEIASLYSVSPQKNADYALADVVYKDAVRRGTGYEVAFEATIENRGLSAGEGYRIDLVCQDQTVASVSVDSGLASGASDVISGTFVVDSIPASNTQYDVCVVGEEDPDLQNNTQTICLGQENIILELTDVSILDDCYIMMVTVSNRGLFSVDTEVKVIPDDQEPLFSSEMTLIAGDTVQCCFTVDCTEIEFEDIAKNVGFYLGSEEISSAGYIIYKPHEHNKELTENAIPPTCTASGSTGDLYCSICGEFVEGEEPLDALGHDWDEGTVTIQPTESEAGVRTYTCTRCGETRNEFIPAVSIDKTVLDEAVFIAENVDTSAYTKESVTVLEAAIAVARAVQANPDASQTQVNDAAQAVRSAFAALVPKADGPVNPFTDVAEGAYYYNPVLWAVNHSPQVTNGTSATSFSPDRSFTRAQVVTFLWRAMGQPEPTKPDNPFTDVAEGQYYYKAVLWAVGEGITTGTSTTTFSPDRGCTRAQVVTFLWRAEDQPKPKSVVNPFKDVAEGQYYSTAVLWAVEKEITKGTSTDKFSPDSTCTRGQIVTFLYRNAGE